MKRYPTFSGSSWRIFLFCSLFVSLFLCQTFYQWEEVDSTIENQAFFDFSPQGVAHVEEKYFIFSGKNLLRTTTQNTNLSEIQTLVTNHNPLGELPSEYNLRHIGDGDVGGDGNLYLPIEDEGYNNPMIAVFNPKTLEFTGTLIPASFQSHCPWVVWFEGMLISSEYDNVTQLFLYNATPPYDPIEAVGIGFSNGQSILWPNGFLKIQGGAMVPPLPSRRQFHSSPSFLALSSADTNQPLITVNLNVNDGNYQAGAEEEQYFMTGGEQEGITSPPDGSLYSVVSKDVYTVLTRYIPVSS